MKVLEEIDDKNRWSRRITHVLTQILGVQSTLEHSRKITQSEQRAYALLGIAEALIEKKKTAKDKLIGLVSAY